MQKKFRFGRIFLNAGTYTGSISRRRGGMIMTDRELLESFIEKSIANQSQINNIEFKIDQFIKEQKEIMYKLLSLSDAHF